MNPLGKGNGGMAQPNVGVMNPLANKQQGKGNGLKQAAGGVHAMTAGVNALSGAKGGGGGGGGVGGVPLGGASLNGLPDPFGPSATENKVPSAGRRRGQLPIAPEASPADQPQVPLAPEPVAIGDAPKRPSRERRPLLAGPGL